MRFGKDSGGVQWAETYNSDGTLHVSFIMDGGSWIIASMPTNLSWQDRTKAHEYVTQAWLAKLILEP